MKAHPDVVRDVVARGHAVGAHGVQPTTGFYSLRSQRWLRDDADREEDVWEEVLRDAPVLFRPPIGLMNPRIARLARERDRTIVAWTVRPRDGLARTPVERVVSRVSSALRPGSIVLLHDSAEDDSRPPAALAALPSILDATARLGLSARAVSLPGTLLPSPKAKELPPP